MCGSPVVVMPVSTISINFLLSKKPARGPVPTRGPRISYRTRRVTVMRDSEIGPIIIENECPTNASRTDSVMSTDLAPLFRRHIDALGIRLEFALAAARVDGLIVHAGSAPAPDWDDQPYPFRVQPLFAQWCPHPSPEGAALVLEPGRKPGLLMPSKDDYWHAAPEPPAAWWADIFEIEFVKSERERDRRLSALGSRFAAIGAGQPDTDGPRTDKSGIVRRHLDYERAIKTDYEIECIARANRAAAAGHVATATAFGDGRSELDLELEYMRASRQRSHELPYPNIVALNEHAAVLHYDRSEPLAPDRSRTLLIDAGARYLGYAADITRTHLSPDSPLAELHAALEALQGSLCADAIAGMEFAELNEQAHRRLARILADHGLVRSGPDSAYESGLTRLFLPHGLGHLLGLQVHDPAGRQRTPLGPATPPPAEHPHLRLTRALEPGFVVTIEPGLYFIESLYRALPKKLAGLLDRKLFESLIPEGGIRIEDDVAVEAGDNRNLSREVLPAV